VTGPLDLTSEAPLRSEEDLLQVFRSGFKPASAWGAGIEYERLALDAETGEAAPYSGPRGVERILREVAARSGWSPQEESGRVIGLARGGARVSLEPGAQIELSGAVHPTLRAAAEETAAHLRETAAAAAPLGVGFACLGLHPFTRVEDLEWVPKGRYAILAPFLAPRGALAHHMMKATAGIQVNFDYADEADATEKLRTAMGLTSIVTAACANSPVSGGGLNGWLSRRAAVWLDTDPDRCGLLEFCLRDDLTLLDYARYALEVPVIFVQRQGRLLGPPGMTFRRFLEEGWQGLGATVSDWVLHLTTIFTEVRLKSYLEVRGHDSLGPALALAVAALWKGILYDAAARREAWSLVSGLPFEERMEFHRAACRDGPAARLGEAAALDLAREMVRIARGGLDRLAASQGTEGSAPCAPGESALLDPLAASLDAEGGCPGARLAASWKAWGRRRAARLIEEAEAEAGEFLAAWPDGGGASA
jgi:glutamate--cysteine ligase